MQDSTSITSAFPQLKATTITPQFPEQEQLKCPRCDSNNTKFCYYNNYNLSQPRHYCKSCKRYWTKGGALRNIPIGGASRKNTKKSSSSSSKRSLSSLSRTQLSQSDLGLGSEPESKPVPTLAPQVGTGLGLPSPAGGGGVGVGVGGFSSLLGMATEGQFGELMVEGLGSSGLWLGQDDGPGQNMGLELMEGNGGGGITSEGLSIGGVQNSVWPDLAIYTQPGSKFQ